MDDPSNENRNQLGAFIPQDNYNVCLTETIEEEQKSEIVDKASLVKPPSTMRLTSPPYPTGSLAA